MDLTIVIIGRLHFMFPPKCIQHVNQNHNFKTFNYSGIGANRSKFMKMICGHKNLTFSKKKSVIRLLFSSKLRPFFFDWKKFKKEYLLIYYHNW